MANKPRPRWYIRVLHDVLQLAKDEKVAVIDGKFVDPKLDALSAKARRDEDEQEDEGDDRLGL